MDSKCEKYKELIVSFCNDGMSYSEIAERLPEHVAIGTIWRYARSIGAATKGINKAAFKKGNKTGEKKRKEVAWEVNENGCWICTSHKPGKAGYSTITINRQITFIHRLMYEKKYGPIPNNMEVCHKCDNPNCINPDHLFLGTHKKNMEDMVSKNRQTYGQRNPMAKLTNNDIVQIRSLRNHKQAELAAMFEVTQPTISMVLNNQRWQHA